jgi:phosphoribosyl-AMP cyclohydrolase
LVDSFKPACHTGHRSCFHNELNYWFFNS